MPNKKQPQNIARIDDMVVYATRYCYTRRSYAIMDAQYIIQEHWNNISQNTKITIKNDLKREIEQLKHIIEDDNNQITDFDLAILTKWELLLKWCNEADNTPQQYVPPSQLQYPTEDLTP